MISENQHQGFTLIELLIVIAIMGLLSAIVLMGSNNTRAKARDAKRENDLRQLQMALELYFDRNQMYPSTENAWWGISDNGGNKTINGENAYIPGLTPAYVNVLPIDPLKKTNGWSGYLYRSNGVNYKLLDHSIGPESFPKENEPFYDPIRPTWAWMVCSGEPACSSW